VDGVVWTAPFAKNVEKDWTNLIYYFAKNVTFRIILIASIRHLVRYHQIPGIANGDLFKLLSIDLFFVVK